MIRQPMPPFEAGDIVAAMIVAVGLALECGAELSNPPPLPILLKDQQR